MKEKEYDKLLHIHTIGEQKGFLRSYHYHRYEPTPYEALDYLFSEIPIHEGDRIVDFGSGKGRLPFYVHYFFRAIGIGIEMNEQYYDEAECNLQSYLENINDKKVPIHFHHGLAEDYNIHSNDNYFYIFNPFSVQIFIKVVNRILRSIEESYRQVYMILYYPSEEYIFYLENHPLFLLTNEIKLPMYESNSFERVLVYSLGY
ncbi:SAM-dependent methyltransferase [Cytobacillus spongiae]|uniref:SAM-dependent methyltransferase n=1 Tax=Cytobacillus spongiae TaxID=2901381 RepID=UPI001F1FF7D2|nr:SAM-dependent methyltransferase [Cytobacillus spongiae]UII57103.1 SAM-dependent methyltransferase [Cytobacillus spongiae]